MTTEQLLWETTRRVHAWDLPGGEFLADGRHCQPDDDKSCFWPRGSAQMLECGEVVLVRPVVRYFGEHEDISRVETIERQLMMQCNAAVADC